ncbi:MAG: hypothetical protein HOL58_06055 [Francisellaceae bacterium]|nr:hypothetical protein [Francisellaceae bacterium]
MILLDTEFGKRLLKEETSLLYENQFYLQNSSALVIGDSRYLECLQVAGGINVCEVAGNVTTEKSIVSRFDKLAVDQESKQIVYLPHVLEDHVNPHEILRETYRILEPEGIALITTLNPVGMLSLPRLTNKIFKSGYKTYNMFSALKLKDWLRVLGFEVFSFQPYYYALPLTYNIVFMYPGRKLFKNELKVPFSHLAYLMIVSKRNSTMTPIKITAQERELAGAVLET